MSKSKDSERRSQEELLDQKFSSILNAINNLSQNMQKMQGRMYTLSDEMQEMKTDLQGRMKDLSDKMQEMKTDLLSRIEALSEEVRFIKSDMQKMQYRIDDLSNELQDVKRNMQVKIDGLSRRIAHNTSVLKSINLRETFGLSLLLSPGQQASIGVSGFDIE